MTMTEYTQTMETWELWYPAAAADGLPFARGKLDPTDVLIVHSAPETLRVEVRDDEGNPLATADGLERTSDRPMARLTRRGDAIERVDCWPDPIDIGRPVILPGGEVGILQAWWNAEDGSEWRWSVEFYNRR